MAHLAIPKQAFEQSPPCTVFPFRGYSYCIYWNPTLLHVEKLDGAQYLFRAVDGGLAQVHRLECGKIPGSPGCAPFDP
ncbi:UNVERIFIED_CONTAM: hypothetical protein Sangu_2792900 [Sesamum angustifolium]|uniref:Uncharacterized protein n=1 Tax=Sesamum angustifolium TaxID=2727405 RepID=A0AAW2ISV3_9LAMI